MKDENRLNEIANELKVKLINKLSTVKAERKTIKEKKVKDVTIKQSKP